MHLRLMEEKDLEIVSILESLSYPVPWQKHNFASELSDNDYAYMYVLEEKGVVIGYAGFYLVDEVASITKVTINSALANQGLGTYLLGKLILIMIDKGAKQINLEVRVSNLKAIHLYQKFDFRIIYTRKGYYSDGEDAYIMVLGGEEYEESYIRN